MSFLASAFRPLAARAPALRSPALSAPARLLSQQVKATIDKAVTANPVVLFMKGTPAVPQCGFSRAVVQLLDINQVDNSKLKTYNVLEDQELRDAIKEYSSWPTIPQLYVNGEFVGGCDILMGMHQSGELEEFFNKQGIVQAAEESSTKQA